MKQYNYNRKDFLRKLFSQSNEIFENLNYDPENVDGTGLNEKQYTFLKDYLNWLIEFKKFVVVRSENELDMTNNMKLMELASQIEKKRPELEKHMEDPLFRGHFNYITQEISASI